MNFAVSERDILQNHNALMKIVPYNTNLSFFKQQKNKGK